MNLRKAPRTLVLTVGYVAMMHAAAALALAFRYDGRIPAEALSAWAGLALAWTAASLVAFWITGLYHSLWRYAGTATVFLLVRGIVLSAVAWAVLAATLGAGRLPVTLAPLIALLQLVLLGGARLGWRLWRERQLGGAGARLVRTLVIGADHAAVGLVQEMRRNRSGEEGLDPVGFVDADPRLTGHLIEGLKVFGTLADLPRVLAGLKPEVAVVANPELPGKAMRAVATACAAAGVRLRTVPAMSELRPGSRVTLARVRDLRLEDLLARAPIPPLDDELGALLRGQRVLVTGAGGSIGSELARQVARSGPAALVLLDHAENGLYFTQRELAMSSPTLPLTAVLADLRDRVALERVFVQHQPSIVLHAAAHKHVPLLEDAPREGVLNNVVSTRHLVDAVLRHGVGHFVLISSDKAVAPSSVMGATKRVCERIVQAASTRATGVLCAVRFGNVLGTDGSVVPLFQRQLERGGPLTVTHPDVTRYFMTIPEAVRLVLQAAALGTNGKVYLLDMGEPVKVLDLARQMIKLAGLREGEDVDIVFTGLRPGEKLHEELHSHAEATRATRRDRILLWDLSPEDDAVLGAQVAELERIAATGDDAAIRAALVVCVPEYTPVQGGAS